jgi:hypothetical protein
LHHGFLSWHFTVFIYVVYIVLIRYEAVLVRFTVSAHGDVGAFHSVVVASGSVDGAGLIGDVILVHPLEGIKGIPSMATIVSWAGNENLRSDVDVWPGSISRDLYSVWKGRSGGMGPARSTVLGNMLIPQVGEVVGGVNVVPHPVVWEGHVLQLSSYNGCFVASTGLSAWFWIVHTSENVICNSWSCNKSKDTKSSLHY